MSTMLSSFDVIVTGGGVGGGAAALAFSRQGLRVLVLEMRPAPGNINRGTSLLPAVTRLLSGWGVLDRFLEAGAVPMPGIQVFDHQRGLILEAPFVNLGAHPYLVLDHPDIERVFLEEAVRTGLVSVRYSTRVTALTRDGERVCGVEAVEVDGERTHYHARLVVGADGSTSIVRRLLRIEVPSKAYDTCYFGLNFERPPGYRDGMRLHLHPEGGLMVVPNRPGMVGVAVFVRAADTELFRTGPLEERIAAIRRRADILRDCVPVPRSGHLYPLSRAHALRYGRDGAVLIGDAVHMTHPTGGQGMTMAIEDAAALASHVGPALERGLSDDAVDAALAGHQHERWPLNAGLLRWSHVMGTAFGHPGAAADLLRRSFFSFCGTSVGGWMRRRMWQRMGNRPSRSGLVATPAQPAFAVSTRGSVSEP